MKDEYLDYILFLDKHQTRRSKALSVEKNNICFITEQIITDPNFYNDKSYFKVLQMILEEFCQERHSKNLCKYIDYRIYKQSHVCIYENSCEAQFQTIDELSSFEKGLIFKNFRKTLEKIIHCLCFLKSKGITNSKWLRSSNLYFTQDDQEPVLFNFLDYSSIDYSNLIKYQYTSETTIENDFSSTNVSSNTEMIKKFNFSIDFNHLEDLKSNLKTQKKYSSTTAKCPYAYYFMLLTKQLVHQFSSLSVKNFVYESSDLFEGEKQAYINFLNRCAMRIKDNIKLPIEEFLSDELFLADDFNQIYTDYFKKFSNELEAQKLLISTEFDDPVSTLDNTPQENLKSNTKNLEESTEFKNLKKENILKYKNGFITGTFF